VPLWGDHDAQWQDIYLPKVKVVDFYLPPAKVINMRDNLEPAHGCLFALLLSLCLIWIPFVLGMYVHHLLIKWGIYH
jgi:hypothetical protein